MQMGASGGLNCVFMAWESWRSNIRISDLDWTLSYLRSVRDRVLALPLPAARVHPREDGDGHDDPADPGGHVRGGQAEHAQSQLRVGFRNEIKTSRNWN